MRGGPSRRHISWDGIEQPLTRRNTERDGCDTPPLTRHTRPKSAATRPYSIEPPCPSHVATERATSDPVTAGQASNQIDGHDITVLLPDDLPVLNERASRILLPILVRLTHVEAPDGPMEGDGRDW